MEVSIQICYFRLLLQVWVELESMEDSPIFFCSINSKTTVWVELESMEDMQQLMQVAKY